MIDLVVVIVLALWGFTWVVRRHIGRWGAGKMAAGAAVLSAVFLGACVLSLTLRAPRYDHVVHPSPASQAGIEGRGVVSAEGGLLSVLGQALSRETLELSADGKTFTRSYPVRGRWKFWRALDSYVLEEASGGFAFFPRRPLFRGNARAFNSQIQRKWGEGVRIVALHGKPTPSIGAFLEILAPVPLKGVVQATVMQPSPDNSTVGVVLSPGLFEETGPTTQAAQTHLGFSSLPLAVTRPEGNEFYAIAYGVNGRPVYGPAGLAEPAQKLKNVPGKALNIYGSAYPLSGRYFRVTLMPRLALVPWLHESALVTFLAGVPGTYLRQLFSLTHLIPLVDKWHLVPKQLYALDDAITTPFLWFKLSSFFASCALALLFWMALLRRPRAEPYLRRPRVRSAFLFAVALALQWGDLFVFHQFLL